jgi:hypothetical protein
MIVSLEWQNVCLELLPAGAFMVSNDRRHRSLPQVVLQCYSPTSRWVPRGAVAPNDVPRKNPTFSDDVGSLSRRGGCKAACRQVHARRIGWLTETATAEIMHLIELTVEMIHDGQGSRKVSGLSPTRSEPKFRPRMSTFWEKNKMFSKAS